MSVVCVLGVDGATSLRFADCYPDAEYLKGLIFSHMPFESLKIRGFGVHARIHQRDIPYSAGEPRITNIIDKSLEV